MMAGWTSPCRETGAGGDSAVWEIRTGKLLTQMRTRHPQCWENASPVLKATTVMVLMIVHYC